MKILFIIISILFSFQSIGQRKFCVKRLTEIVNRQDFYSEIKASTLDSNEINIKSNFDVQLENVFFNSLVNAKKKKDTLYSSKILHDFALITQNYFHNKKFRWKKFWKIKRFFERALPYFNTNFGLINAYSIQLPISKFKGTSYYNEKDSRSSIHLFFRKNQQEFPVPLYNEIEFSELIKKELLKIDFIRDNKFSSFSNISYSYKIEQSNKNEIPKIRFYVFFGGKRLKLVEQKLKKPQTL